jgi:hypothetical protein
VLAEHETATAVEWELEFAVAAAVAAAAELEAELAAAAAAELELAAIIEVLERMYDITIATTTPRFNQAITMFFVVFVDI